MYRTNLFAASATVACLFVILSSLPVLGKTIRVPDDKPQIQAAIDSAADGDTVLVSPGTYKENIDFKGKAITVISSVNAGSTIIEAAVNEVPVVTFAHSETRSSVLAGFTIQGGNITGNLPGAGICTILTSPTITKNIIQDNHACHSGSGIGINSGSPMIEGNLIRNNTGVEDEGCKGYIGGGIAAYASNAYIIDNLIEDNRINGNGGGIGGAQRGSLPLVIRNNVIRRNGADYRRPGGGAGGGIFTGADYGSIIVQNLIYRNRARSGSGIFIQIPDKDFGPLLVNNTVVAERNSDAVYAFGPSKAARFFNNITIGGSGRHGVFCDAPKGALPPLFVDNDAFTADADGFFGGKCADQAGQNGNISADPLFVPKSQGHQHFRLQPGSPGIDTGDNSAPRLPKHDVDRAPRLADGNGDGEIVVDMGAYELPPKE